MYSAFPGQFQPMAGSFQSIDLDNSTASALTLPSGAQGGPKYALIMAVDQDVHWRDDGADPVSTAGGGMLLVAGQPPIGFLGDLGSIRFISTNVAGSTLLVSYYS